MEFTGERYIPEVESPEISYEHWHRYLFAGQFVKGKVVLDVACGEGYGSYFLSTTAKKVTGVDVSQETISYAASKYVKDNLEFKTGLVSSIPTKEDSMFDVIVSFETIEHISGSDQVAFLAEVKRLLKPNGVFVVSTPNKLIYSDLPKYKNEFHIKEFYIPEFKELLDTRFQHVDLLGQKIEVGSYMAGLDNKRRTLTEYRINFSEKGFHPTNEPRDILYLIAVCSDKPLAKVSASFSVDISESMIRIRDRQISELKNQVAKREQSFQTLTGQLAERDQTIKTLTTQVAEKEQEVQTLIAQVAERDQNVQALKNQVAEREQKVQALTNQVAEREQKVQALTNQVAEREQKVQALTNQVAERDQKVQSLAAQVTEKYQALQSLTAQVAERDQKVQSLATQVTEKDQALQSLTAQMAELEKEVLHYAMSKSWRFTRPFRKIVRIMRGKKNA